MHGQPKWFTQPHDDDPGFGGYDVCEPNPEAVETPWIVAHVEDEETAGQIVVAVNSHDSLVAALRHIAWEPLTDDAEADERTCLDEVQRIARAALHEARPSPREAPGRGVEAAS